MPDAPSISIVIRAFNEERHLPGLFDLLDRQTCQDFETIVVDSGSYDDTLEIARARADRVVEVRPDDFTFGHSLNVGIDAALGGICAIVSAHAIPTDEHWLAALVAPFEDRAVLAAAYGRQVGVADSKFAEAQDFLRTFPPTPVALDADRFFVNNANAAIRRDLWEEHPFDEALPGLEDLEWAKHWLVRGREVLYVPEACVAHHHEESWPRVRHRYEREALAAQSIRALSRRDIPARLAREGLSLAADLRVALRASAYARVPEICRFRWEKSIGTTMGIWRGAAAGSPAARPELVYERRQRAVVIRGVREASLVEIAVPQVRPGEVLVRVAYTGVCRTDLEIFEGRLGFYRDGRGEYPIVPGHELSGRVAEIGARADAFVPGDPVVVDCIQGCGHCGACAADNAIACADRRELGVLRLDGGYAEYVIAPYRAVHRVPDGLDLLHASLCEPTAVVLKALRRVAAVAPDGPLRYAVVGGGPIGHLAARILSLRGHEVTVFDRRLERRDLFRGSEIATSSDLTELATAQVVVEATGDPGVLDPIFDNSQVGARILLVGLPYARQPFSFESVVSLDKVIVGSVGSSHADFEEALQILPELQLDPFFEHVVPIERFEQAWDDAVTGAHLKSILAVHGDESGDRIDDAGTGSRLLAAHGLGRA